MLNIGGWQSASSDLADMDEGGIFVIKIGCASIGTHPIACCFCLWRFYLLFYAYEQYAFFFVDLAVVYRVCHSGIVGDEFNKVGIYIIVSIVIHIEYASFLIIFVVECPCLVIFVVTIALVSPSGSIGIENIFFREISLAFSVIPCAYNSRRNV